MNILVTGGAGFIGSHMCKRFIDEGNTVFCLDNYLTGSKSNVEEHIDNPRFHLIEHDIAKDLGSLATQFPKLDAIFHLASPASPNAKSSRSYMSFPIETLLTNSQGTYYLLELAMKHEAKFLFTSTSEVYGDPAISPQPETYYGNVNPNGVRSVYDEAKRFGEAITFAYKRKYGVDARIVRLFNTYGPNMQKDDGRVVSNFINQALQHQPMTIYGDGNQTRSFSYVSDTVEGIIKAMFTEGTSGEVFNIGNPDERTVHDIALIIKRMVDSSSEIVYEPMPADDPKKRKPDIAKANKVLQWSPKVTLEEGLTKTIAYFKGL